MVIEKPWGKEELLEKNNKYMVKRLTMHKGHRCSLQFHKYKIETIYVLAGILTIEIDENYYHGDKFNLKILRLKQNESITINSNVLHRMSAIEGDSIYLESSTPEIEDVVRVNDDYKRK